MKYKLALLLGGSLFLGCNALADTTKLNEKSRPNILFVFADDWGWGDLSCHGHPYIKTPNIDSLAKEGTDFQNFTVASGVCSPSRTAVMTGLFPARLSVNGHFSKPRSNASRGMPDWVDPTLPMLPRILQDSGYMTGHFGKWHLSNNTVPDSPRPEVYGYDMVGAFNCSGEQMPVHDDTKNAIKLIEKSVEAKKPFFINLWIHEPHTPYHTLPEYRKRFPDLPDVENVYASVLSHADDRIGEILATLDRLDLAKNTLVIFSSDNGPAGGGSKKKSELNDKTMFDSATGIGYGHEASHGTTGGRKGRKKSIFQGGIGIPFIARWPGKISAGAKDDVSWISAVDLLPTFCEIAEAPLPKNFQPDGESQLKVLMGEKAPLREKPLFWKKQGGEIASDNYAIISGKWKLLTSLDFAQIQLYDISSDPLEQNDVASSNPEVIAVLIEEIKAWITTLPEEVEPKLFSNLRSKSGE